MNVPQLSIKRPVLTIMLNSILILMGVISYFRVGVQENPNMTFPVISVVTPYPGGSASIINETLTKPIENALNTIDGVLHISSTSSNGRSTVELTFNLGQDLNAAFAEVQSKLNAITDELPQEAKPPQISKASSQGTPIMQIALFGNRTLQQLSDIARYDIKPKLETIPGMGTINILGTQKASVKVILNINHMAEMKISPADVQNALSEHQFTAPGGFITSEKKQFSLNLDLAYHELNKLEDLIITYRENQPIFLRNIATVKLDVSQNQQAAHFNGRPSVGISFTKKDNSNTVFIVNEIQKRIHKEIIPALPPGVKIGVVFEEANYILGIIHSLETDMWLSLFAAGLVIFIFLKNVRSTYIIMTAIPVSLLGAIAAIYFFGFTFNVVTLLSLILLIGIVVDDAIVMLENIHRYAEVHQVSAYDAAVQGSNQVVFAVFAASLSLIAIFGPVIFMGSIIGLFFKSFAIVVTVGVLISLFVSMTLTPMLCSKFLLVNRKPSKVSRLLEGMLHQLDVIYRRLLINALDYKYIVVAFTFILVLLSIPLYYGVGKSFMPAQRDSGTFNIMAQAPQGYNIQYTQQKVKKITDILDTYPEIDHYFTSIQPVNIANISVQLKPYYLLSTPQDQLMDILRQRFSKIPGIQTFISNNNSGGSQIDFDVIGPNYQKLQDASVALYYALAKEKSLKELYINFTPSSPSYHVIVNHALAAQLNITPRQIANTLMILGDGFQVAKFNKTLAAQRYDVVLQAQPGQFKYPQDIDNFYLPGRNNEMVRLDTIAKLKADLSPASITRKDLMYSIGFSATPTISMGKAVAIVEQIGKNTLPPGYTISLSGNTESFEQMDQSVMYALMGIIVLLYMVLASQFNSYLQPLIILVAQPLAMVGGLFILWLVGATLNIYSVIGILLLMGLVAKNSILLIDLTNQLRDQGMSKEKALREACPTRMRPVLMTSLTIIFSMLPATFSTGPGSSIHRALSLVIIGGMISSTLLTLVVVPAVYALVVKENNPKNSELSESQP